MDAEVLGLTRLLPPIPDCGRLAETDWDAGGSIRDCGRGMLVLDAIVLVVPRAEAGRVDSE